MARLRPSDRVLTPEDRWWKDEATRYRREALSRTRAAATGWGTTMGGAIAAFGLVAFFKGPDVFAGLGAAYRLAAQVAVLIAFAVALLAVILAGLAAHGSVRATRTTADAVAERHAWELAVAVRRLRRSRLLAGFALTLLVAAIGVSWFAPRAAQQVVITRPDGSTLCLPAKLLGSGVTVPAGDARSARTAPTCPPSP